TISTVYPNFCHGTITPEELILDFGLNTQMGPNPNVPVKLTHRVVMNFYTAKRLLNFLHWTINRYESQFGVLETDFQRRVRSPLTPTAGPRPGSGGGLGGGGGGGGAARGTPPARGRGVETCRGG